MSVDPRILAALNAPLRKGLNAVVLPRKPAGYAAHPETGPAGETCRSCHHSHPVESPGGSRFWKCRLVQVTHGPGPDIRLKSPACRKWEAARADG